MLRLATGSAPLRLALGLLPLEPHFRDPPDGRIQGETRPVVEEKALAIAAAVVRLFEHPSARELWTGYDARTRPLVLYVPDRWALLLNVSRPPPGFVAYPETWPELGASASLWSGRYGELVGQLSFDLEFEGGRAAAIPLADALFPPSDWSSSVFAFIVHEAFHQYQSERFASVDTQPEEPYPILDPENTALAAVEMRLLMDAVRASERPGDPRLTPLAEEFVAVRTHRWRRATPLVERLEREKELVEGTANYVEVRSVALMSEICGQARPSDRAASFCRVFPRRTLPEVLLQDFEQRLRGLAPSPEDMPRNRIYPVGAALGCILDVLGVPWKAEAERAGGTFSFLGALRARLGTGEEAVEARLERARKRYDYAAILGAANRLVDAYRKECGEALEAFEAQRGRRLRLTLPSSGLVRSRSSRTKRWVLDGGLRVFSGRYLAYTLRSAGAPGLSLQVNDAGVLEEEDPSARRKTVVCVLPEAGTIEVDGRRLGDPPDGTYGFRRLLLERGTVRLSCDTAGVLRIASRDVLVEVEEPSGSRPSSGPR
jgi:hypothetical protein